MMQIPIALQLYSVRDDCAQDFPGTLKAVAEMGYRGVEFAGYYNYSAQQIRKMMDDLGLEAAGTHTSLESLLGDELPRAIEFNRVLRNRFLIIAYQKRETRAQWLELARSLNEIAARLALEEMQTGYHNHFDEFKPTEGELPWDTVIANTGPAVVMQMDTGNSLQGGADAVQFLEKYPGRAITVHMKDYTPKNDQALIGEGEVRWAEVLRLCQTTAGTQWYIVEQERFAYPPLECARRNLEALQKLQK